MTDALIDYVNSKTLSKRADVDLNNEEEAEMIEIMLEDAYAEHQPALLMPVGEQEGDEGGYDEAEDGAEVGIEDHVSSGTQNQPGDVDGFSDPYNNISDPQYGNSDPLPTLQDTDPPADFSDPYGELEDTSINPELFNDIVEEVLPRHRYGTRQQTRELEQAKLRNLLNMPVATFVGIGLQMELHEARAKYGLRAVRAAADEIKQILKKEVWRGVTVEEMKNYPKPIPSSMKAKEKFKGGLLDRLKCRLTGGGHRQCKATFQDIKYAPTVSTTAVMAGMTIAAAENRAVATLDFTGAFLYADMPTERERATLVRLGHFLTRILVKLDPSYEKYVQDDGTCVVILQKALYGTIIAAAAWYKKISNDLKDLGYSVSNYDNCVFYKQILGKQMLIFLHVDDMFFAAAGGEAAIDIAVNEIKSKYDEVTVHRGKKLTYLGMDADFSIPGEVSLSVCDYVDNAIKMFEEKHGKLIVSRVPANYDIFKTSSTMYSDPLILKINSDPLSAK
jgi:hypothetical protein